MSEKYQCGNCRFFIESTCHKSAPTVKVNRWVSSDLIYQDDGSSQRVPLVIEESSNGFWPQVSFDDYCGQWEKKDES